MKLKDAIAGRHSVRTFLKRKVEREKINYILTIAVNAPSSANLQPWHFVVLDDPELIAQACRTNLDAYWGKRAPVAILVCTDTDRHKKGFWSQGCAAVTQNILLMAYSEGLGATWTGVYPIKERVEGLSTLLNLPHNLIPFSLVILGYAKEKGVSREYSTDGKVSYNRFPASTRYSIIKEGKKRKRTELR